MVAAAFGLLLTSGLDAYAQTGFFERDRYEAVTDRSQPEFDAAPIRLGAFNASPRLRAGVGSTSNLFASATDETSDTYLLARPSVDINSTWSRHAIGASLVAERTEYSDTSSESATDLSGQLYGRLDATSRLSFVGSTAASRVNEPRSSVASIPDATEPVEIHRIGAEVGADYEANRVRLRGRLAVDNHDYRDVALNSGLIRDQDFRDREEKSASVRASYAPRRDYAVFAEAIVTDRSYDAPNALNPLNRDSQGTIIRVGTNFELPILVRGDIAVGYHQFEYDDAAFADVDGLSVEANASWFVTQLTTVSGSASRRVVDPGLQNAAGATQTGLSARVDHELRRNLLINGELEYSGYEFEGLNRDDDRYRASIGTTWKLNRHAALNVSYQHIEQNSNQQPFTDNRLLAAITIYP